MGKYWGLFIVLVLCIPFVYANNNTTTNTSLENITVEIYELEAMAIALSQEDGNVLSVVLEIDNTTQKPVYEVRVQDIEDKSTRYTVIDANTGEILSNYDEIDFTQTEEYLKPRQFFFLEEGKIPSEENTEESQRRSVRVPVQPSRWNIFKAWIRNIFD